MNLEDLLNTKDSGYELVRDFCDAYGYVHGSVIQNKNNREMPIPFQIVMADFIGYIKKRNDKYKIR